MQLKHIMAITITLCCAAITAHARPVSYPGGWTVMMQNDVDHNSLHVHKTIDPKTSIGLRHNYNRDTSVHTDFIQYNKLLKRWNARASQGNLYLKSGIGVAYTSDDTRAAAFTGIAADWEDRRKFISYENHFHTAGNLGSFASHKARIGIAPYVGGYGDLHTWLMLEADYTPGEADDFSLTPLVRFFKDTHLLEAGYNLDGGMMLNYIKRF